MAKIQCPHCKAVNQDVSLNDPCWQCGTILSAPPSALETGEGPPSSAVSSANVNAPVQQQVERDKGDRSPSPHSPSPTLNKAAIWIIVLVIALIIAIAIFFMTKHG